MLVLGGTAGRRFQVAHAFHRCSRIARGPLVCLDGGRDEAVLRESLHAFMGSLDAPARDPIATAEYGTLFVDSISRLSPRTQRLLLEFCSHHLNARGQESPRPWAGRLIVGDGGRIRVAVLSNRFSMALFDTLDKLRVDLPAVRRAHGAQRLTA